MRRHNIILTYGYFGLALNCQWVNYEAFVGTMCSYVPATSGPGYLPPGTKLASSFIAFIFTGAMANPTSKVLN